MQSPLGRDLLAQFGIDPDDPSTSLVLNRGQALTASDAVIHVTTAVGGVWRLVQIAHLVPPAWRDAMYRVLARNRHRWFGRRKTCYLPKRI
jgi:predicted DCC family thiol-disulfide oxidoreductase YuxK